MGATDIIEVVDLEHTFGEVEAVRGISFAVKKLHDALWATSIPY
jgi:ABC-type branched-subunit amino acid transport system ATPase component